jgi:hypothetical protein
LGHLFPFLPFDDHHGLTPPFFRLVEFLFRLRWRRWSSAVLASSFQLFLLPHAIVILAPVASKESASRDLSSRIGNLSQTR